MIGLQVLVRRACMSLSSATAATTVANLTILAGNAGAGVLSARALGPGGRGQLAIVMLWSAVISMVGNLGLPSSCSYHVARWPDRRAVLADWYRRVALRQAFAMTVVSGLILWWLRLSLHLPPLLTIEYVTWAAGATISLYAACYTQGLADFSRFNTIRMIPSIAPAGLMVANAAMAHLTPSVAGAAYLGPTWCSAGIGYVWLRRDSMRAIGRPVSPEESRSMWSYGWRSLASFSGLALNRSSDQLALGLLVPVGSFGLYSVAVGASSPLPFIVASFGMVGLPRITALAGRAKITVTWKTLLRAAAFLGVLLPPLAILLPRALPLVYGHQYSAAVVPAELLLLGSAFAALASVVDDLLRAHEHPGFVSITQGVGGAVTILGTVLLDGRPLFAVALVSSLGYFAAFALAFGRLWLALLRSTSQGSHRAVRSQCQRL